MKTVCAWGSAPCSDDQDSRVDEGCIACASEFYYLEGEYGTEDGDEGSLEDEEAITCEDGAMAADALGGLGLAPPSSLRLRRKFSTPAAFCDHNGSALVGHAQAASARRRFSNVSDVVSRKLSSTIGWRTTPAPSQEIVNQGKALCGQYIRSRLKRAGVFNRKCGLQRLRSAVALPTGIVLREVLPELVAVGQELERRHPKLFTGVARQASAAPGGLIVSDAAAAAVLTAVGRELLKQDVTWGKVVSLYAVAGGLAVDCVRQGHPEYLHALVAALGEILEDDLASWIASNGGWAALVQHCAPPDTEVSLTLVAGILCAAMIAMLAAVLALRCFGKFSEI